MAPANADQPRVTGKLFAVDHGGSKRGRTSVMPAEPVVHPDMQILTGARDPNPASDLDGKRRQWSEYAAKLSRPPPPELDVNDEHVRAAHGDVLVRFYRHRGASGPRPCVIYLHGGGFVKGDLDASDSNAWGFASETGATVVSVDYRLAPEHPWPAAFDDSYGVLEALVDASENYGIDPLRIVVGGDSAGGLLTAAVAVRARDEGRITLAGQFNIYGNAGTAEDSRSYVDFGEGYNLTKQDMDGFYDMLFGDLDYKSDPYAWPLSNDDLSNLAAAHIHAAEIDPLRDDGRAFAAKLALAGNDVRYREAKGMLHGFMRARFVSEAARAEYEEICAFIRHRIRTPPPEER
jgi:acetyl esterase